jgi:hypothetical protein
MTVKAYSNDQGDCAEGGFWDMGDLNVFQLADSIVAFLAHPSSATRVLAPKTIHEYSH